MLLKLFSDCMNIFSRSAESIEDICRKRRKHSACDERQRPKESFCPNRRVVKADDVKSCKHNKPKSIQKLSRKFYIVRRTVLPK